MNEEYRGKRFAYNNDIDKSAVGKRIKESRLIKPMTMEALGDLLGISKASVNNWEKGKSLPSKEKITELSMILDVSIGYILYGKKEKLSIGYLVEKIPELKNDKESLKSTLRSMIDIHEILDHIDVFEYMFIWETVAHNNAFWSKVNQTNGDYQKYIIDSAVNFYKNSNRLEDHYKREITSSKLELEFQTSLLTREPDKNSDLTSKIQKNKLYISTLEKNIINIGYLSLELYMNDEDVEKTDLL